MPDVQVHGRTAHTNDGGAPWQEGRPVVVLVHAAGMTHVVWQQQTRALAHHGFNVAAPDLPGHGGSADVDGIASVEDYAAWLAEFLAAREVPRARLVGHSMGAAVALTLAATRPDTVEALALLGASARLEVSPALLEALEHDPARAVDFITAYAHGHASHLGRAPTPGAWLLGGGHALLEACPPEVLRRDFRASHAWDGAALAPQVRCPTLVLSGSEDRMTPARTGRALAEAIPGARFEAVPGAGHMLMTEAPREVLRRLRAFLAGRPE